jgi:hypothetical protein
MKTIPVTSALLIELSRLRNITGSDEMRRACIEAQKGFGPSIADMARFQEMAGSGNQANN